MIGEAAPFVMAALAGLSAHPSESTRTPEDIGERAVSLGMAAADAFAKRLDVGLAPVSDRHPENRGEDTIASAVRDLVERVGALETELGSTPPKGK